MKTAFKSCCSWLNLALILAILVAASACAQTPETPRAGGIEGRINEKLDTIANTKYEFLQAEVLFQVLDTKHSIDFDVLGKTKGFNRRLSRVTAKLVNITVPEGSKQVFAEKYIQANASEIDLEVSYQSTFANGYFMSGNSIAAETVKAFLDIYKKNKSTTFKGYVSVRVAIPPNGASKIDKVHLSHIDVKNVK